MTAIRGYLITMATGIVGAGFGWLLGYGVACFAPYYYVTIFDLPEDHTASDLIELGTGLGLLQGLGAGLVVGLVIVCVVAWYDQRIVAQKSISETDR